MVEGGGTKEDAGLVGQEYAFHRREDTERERNASSRLMTDRACRVLHNEGTIGSLPMRTSHSLFPSVS
jgi:hypothetical protein